jgi:hypothetical protein
MFPRSQCDALMQRTVVFMLLITTTQYCTVHSTAMRCMLRPSFLFGKPLVDVVKRIDEHVRSHFINTTNYIRSCNLHTRIAAVRVYA